MPKVVESLIKGERAMVSERAERVELPRDRIPNLEEVGEGSWPGSISRGTANESPTGSGGRL